MDGALLGLEGPSSGHGLDSSGAGLAEGAGLPSPLLSGLSSRPLVLMESDSLDLKTYPKATTLMLSSQNQGRMGSAEPVTSATS